MTRINLVDPSELTDQHLFAEFREIKMIPKSLSRSIVAAENKRPNSALDYVLSRIPARYTLNTGHVSFFYDKGLYLQNRYSDLRRELERRGIQYNIASLLDPDGTFQILGERFNNDYRPTIEALAIVRARIAEKIAMKPGWYRYKGKPSR